MRSFNNPFAGLEKRIAQDSEKNSKTDEAIDVVKTLEKAHLGRMISDLSKGELEDAFSYKVAIESHRDIDDEDIFLKGLSDAEKQKVFDYQQEANKNIEDNLQKLLKNSWQPLKERFKDITDGRMEHIPDGWSFESQVPGLDSITMIKPKQNEGFYVDINYKNKEGKPSRRNFSVFPDGTFSGEMPKDLQATRQQIFAEILDVLDSVGLDYWHNDEEKILEDHDWPQRIGEDATSNNGVVADDRRRIEFLRKQPDSLFGFATKLNNYKAFVFRNFIVLESPECRNAAFFIDFPEGSELTPEEIASCNTHTGRKRIIETYWKRYENLGKWALFHEPGVERVHHKHVDNWVVQMKELLNSRNNMPGSARDVQLYEQRS